MIRKVQWVLAGVLAGLLSACATGPEFSTLDGSLPALESGKGRVFFYRDGILGSEFRPSILVNGEVVGSAVPRGVFYRDLPAGRYSVTTKLTRATREFDLAAGEQQYVRLAYVPLNCYPELVAPPVGAAAVAELRYTGDR
jgi:hypothetical protein